MPPTCTTLGRSMQAIILPIDSCVNQRRFRTDPVPTRAVFHVDFESAVDFGYGGIFATYVHYPGP